MNVSPSTPPASVAASEPAEPSVAAEPSEGRFQDVEWDLGAAGHPLIAGATAWLECVTHEILPGGDHSIFLGRVVGSGLGSSQSMLYHGGAFGTAGP